MDDQTKKIDFLNKIDKDNIDDFFNSKEQKLIFDEEERSFGRYCQNIGYDEDRFKEDWCNRTFWRIEQRIRGTAKRLEIEIPNNDFLWSKPILNSPYIEIPEISDHNFILPNKNNYWKLSRTLIWRGHIISMASFALTINKIEFDTSNLFHLASFYNIKINNLSDYENIYSLLLKIPIINIYENRFATYINKSSVLGELPSISIYQQLNEGLDAYVDIMLASIDKKNSRNGFDLYLTREINQLLAMKEFRYSLFMILHCLTGNLAVMKTNRAQKASFAYWYPEAEIELHLTKVASKDFVLYHELGHLVLGHLNKTYNRTFEFEADEFAFRTLENTFSTEPTLFLWNLKGIFITLSALEIIEGIKGTNQNQFPSAMERMNNLKNKFTSYFMDDLIDTIHDVIKPMIDEYKSMGDLGSDVNELNKIFLS